MNIKRFMKVDSPETFLATRIYASASSEELSRFSKTPMIAQNVLGRFLED